MVNLSNDLVTRSVVDKCPVSVGSVGPAELEDKGVDRPILVLIDQFYVVLRIISKLLIENDHKLLQDINRVVPVYIVTLVGDSTAESPSCVAAVSALKRNSAAY